MKSHTLATSRRVDAAAAGLGQAIGPDRSRVVRAEVIGALLPGAVEATAGWAAALRLRGAVVTGRLELMGAAIAWPLICERCYFEDAIGFVDCAVKTVSLMDCQLPAFNGTRMWRAFSAEADDHRPAAAAR